METFILTSRLVHIVAGCLALLSGLGAILLRKRTPLHRPFGKIYFWSMAIIFVTAMYLSAYRQNVFLFFIGIFTFHACLTAYRSLKLKQLHLGQKPEPADWLIEALNIAANGGLVAIAFIYAFRGNFQWTIICLVFGSIGLRNSYLNIKRLRGRVKHQSYWLIAHIGGMMGSYIGAITAFMVNNNRWLYLPDVVAWLAPTLLLVPFIVSETAKLKTKKLAA